jgi:pectinesterase
MIGDSTMADKSIEGNRSERGWGMMLPGYLDAKITVDNHARNGRSSKSFRDEGRWQPILDKMKPGDYVIIQFGHNDEKIQDPTRGTDPQTTFRDNLRRYITETRAKGGVPILCTAIVRRNFVDGQLTDTHGEYIQAVFVVGQEMNVPVIDMNKSTGDWLKSMPEEQTKNYFMWIPKGIWAAYPNGLEDNTHLNVAGGRAVAGLAIEEIAEKVPDLAPFVRYYDLVVAKDGSGDFFTVQEAIDAVPDIRKARTTVYIRNGEYREKLNLPGSKTEVVFIGEDVEKTILSYDDYASKKNLFGANLGTSGSAGFYIYGSDFRAENITFANTAGPVGQAVAVFVEGDRIVFRNCRFLGFQDTLYTHGSKSRQYYEDCYIEGTVDFIFGWSTAVFKNCEIRAKRTGGYLTAASTLASTLYGYVFIDCKLTADPDVTGVALGRPWRDYAKTVYIDCEMGAHILPAGWNNWGKSEAEKTAFYAEYNSKGPGGALTKRVPWSHRLTAAQAAEYTVEKILGGTDGWNPVDEKYRPKDQ